MCYSFEVSLTTFITSWGISIYLLNKKNLTNEQKNSIYFLLIFSSIQLADAILWFIKMKKNNINFIVSSIFVPLILSFQILFNLFYKNKGRYTTLNIIGIISIFYLFYKFNGYSKSICNDSYSSPIWGSSELSILEVSIFAILICYPHFEWIYFCLFLFFPFLYIYFDGAYGSLWCAIANVMALYYLFTY